MACGWMNSQVTNKNLRNVFDFQIAAFPSAKRCQSILTITVAGLRVAAKWHAGCGYLMVSTVTPPGLLMMIDLPHFTTSLRSETSDFSSTRLFVQYILKTGPRVGASDRSDVLLPHIKLCFEAALVPPFTWLRHCPAPLTSSVFVQTLHGLNAASQWKTHLGLITRARLLPLFHCRAAFFLSTRPFSPSLSRRPFLSALSFLPSRAPVTRPR